MPAASARSPSAAEPGSSAQTTRQPPGSMRRGERVEDGDVGRGRAVVVEVVGLDVGDDRDGRRVGEERAVALVGLGDEDVAVAVVGARAGGQQVPADHERRVGAAGLQRDDQHRRRRGLARAARDAGGAVVGHELGQHRRAVQHGNASGGGLEQLGVVRVGLVHGLGGDERRGAAGEQVEVGRVVPDGDLRPERPQGQQRAGVLGVGPGHHRAPGQQDARDPAHRRAARADEVHPRQQRRQLRDHRLLAEIGLRRALLLLAHRSPSRRATPPMVPAPSSAPASPSAPSTTASTMRASVSSASA